MKNNLENKAKFFAQYLKQEVYNYGNYKARTLDPTYLITGSLQLSSGWLELKPLSCMNKSDALDVCVVSREDVKWMNMKLESLIVFATHFSQWNIRGVEILRSKDYALPYIGLSVETMVEYGWIKLTS